MQYPKVYILILNWNGWRDTIECLGSLLKLTYPNYTIVVVDNGSTDGSVAKVHEWLSTGAVPPERVVIIENTANLGYAGGNNVGLRFALKQPDMAYVWIVNNDVVVDPAALTHLVERMKEKPGAGIAGSMVMHYHDRGRIAALGGGWYDRWLGQAVHPGSGKLYDPARADKYIKMERKINYIEGSSELVSRSFLEDVGLMCEDYFLFFEEIDWATRGRGRYTLAIAPKSLIYHKGGASVSKMEAGRGLIFDYYNTRNRLIFTLRYFPCALPLVGLSVLGYMLDKLRVGAWENVRVMGRAVADLLLKRTGQR